MSSLPADPQTLDFDTCAREPIHIPGAIQPHGLLLAVREPDLVCTQISDNASALLGLPAAELIGQTLVAGLGEAFAAQIASALAAGDPREASPVPTETNGQSFDALLHRRDGVLIIELEPSGRDAAATTFAQGHRRLQNALAAMRAAPNLPALYPIIAQTIADLVPGAQLVEYDGEPHGLNVTASDRLTKDLLTFLGR